MVRFSKGLVFLWTNVNWQLNSKMVVVHLLSLSIPSHDIINCLRCSNRRQKREACTLRTIVFKRWWYVRRKSLSKTCQHSRFCPVSGETHFLQDSVPLLSSKNSMLHNDLRIFCQHNSYNVDTSSIVRAQIRTWKPKPLACYTRGLEFPFYGPQYLGKAHARMNLGDAKG